MPSISSLSVELKLAAENFNNGLRDSGREAKAFEKNIKPTVDLTKELGEAMSVVGDVVAVAMIEATKKTAEYGAELEHAAQRTGATVEALSRLDFAANQSGSSTEGLNTGLKFLAKNMEAAMDGSKKQSDAFRSLGITTEELSAAHGDVTKVMALVADKFHDVEDGSAKTAVSLALFGRGGTDLIPMLNQGSDAITAMGDTATQLGLVMNDVSAKAAVDFEKSLKQMQGSIEGVGISIGTALMPMLTSVMETVRDAIVSFNSFVTAHEDLTKAIFLITAAIGGTGGLLLAAAGLLLIWPQITEAFVLMTGPIGLATAALIGLGVIAYKFRDEIAAGLVSAFAEIIRSLGWVSTAAGALADKLGLKGLSASLKSAGQSAFDAAEKQSKLSDSFLETNQKVIAQAKVVEDHRSVIIKDTSAVDENDKAQKKLLDSLTKLGNTYEAGKEIEHSLAAAHVDLAAKGREVQASLEAIGETAVLKPLPPDIGLFQIYKTLDILKNSSIPGVNTELGKIPEPIDTIAIHMKKVKDATDDVKQAAGKIFDDMFVTGQNVFTSIQNLLKGGALSLGRAIFEDVSAALLGPIKLAFDDFFKGLLESTGIKNFIDGIGKKIGGILSGAFGGGSPAGVVGPQLPGASSAASGVAGNAISTATSLAGPLISGGIAAAGAIIGSLMLKGNAKATEENTRETRDWLELQTVAWNPVFFGMLSLLQWLADRSGDLINQGDAIFNAILGMDQHIVAAVGGIQFPAPIIQQVIQGAPPAIPGLPPGTTTATAPPPGTTTPAPSTLGSLGSQLVGLGLGGFFGMPQYAEGGISPRRELAVVDAGEMHIPRNKQGMLGNVTNIYVSVKAYDGQDVDRMFRSEIEPRIRKSVKAGGGLYRSIQDAAPVSSTRAIDRK